MGYREVAYVDEAGIEKVNVIASPPGQDIAERDVVSELFSAIRIQFPTQRIGRGPAACLQGEMLHGCGACDVKGFLACLLAAAGSKDARWIDGLRIVLTADEEVGCIGSKRLIANRQPEASSGSLSVSQHLFAPRAREKVIALHGSRSMAERRTAPFLPKGVSAIYAAAHLVSALEELSQQLAMETHDLFEPPFTTVNVGTIEGGSAKNIIPGRADLLVEWRPIPECPRIVSPLRYAR